MIKKFTDEFGITHETKNLSIYAHDNGTYTLQKDSFIVMRFSDLYEIVDFLELTDVEVEQLERDCCLL